MALVGEDRIRQLATVDVGGAPVVTCYLDVDGSRLPRRQDVETELDRLLRRSGRKDLPSGAAADVARIEKHVRAGFDRSHTRGLVVFACGAADLWEVVGLPVAVRSQLVIGPAPALGQLESVVEELGAFGVLLADRKHARVLVFEMGEIVERSELVGDLGRDWDEKGDKERGDHSHHVDDLTARHLRAAAEATWALFQERKFDHLTIGAPDHVASDLEGALHPWLRDRLAPRINVGVGASVEDVRRAALQVEVEVERAQEGSRIAALREAVGTGRGVAGLEAVLGALNERRVDLLLVSDGFEQTGWLCPSDGLLAAVGRTCGLCGSEMVEVDDVVQEAVDVAFSQSGRVDICVGNADLDVLGRIGATLRY
jgi:peptide chain release factor subunit 1